ncbi:MAG: hypothetical protein MJ197_10765 [Bacteroidales bacterium]|nr:hypothetical protein [Bacteroidales bacterium]
MKGGDTVRYIDEMFDMIADEIAAAYKYAEKYILLKKDNKDDWADVFAEMAKSCVEHADSIYTYINIEIKALKEGYTIPPTIQKQWNFRSSQNKDKLAWLEQLFFE